MPHLLALDQGTTSSRAILFDERGQSVATAQREFEQIFPRPGWVEHDPEEIWWSQAACADEVLRAVGLAGSEIAGVGITNQRETTVVWDRASGEPIANAIVWQDRRTADHCQILIERGHADIVRERTGLVLDAYFSATKIAWLLDQVEGARERAERGELAFGTIDSWLVWKLTKGARHVTDPSNASRTMLYDIRVGAWDDDLLDLFRIPASLLPAVVPSSGPIGVVDAPLEARGAMISGMVGDQQAATMGQLAVEPGMAKNTYGTGCFLLMNTGEATRVSRNRLLSTVLWESDQRTLHALEGGVFVGGAAVQWLRDGLGLVSNASEIEALARSVPDAGGVHFVPALTGLGAPWWDSDARGLICGITRGSTGAHLARATLEGIAFQVCDLVSAMEDDAGSPLEELRVDGGAAANDLLLQIQADLLQRPVVRPTVLETTALGAAYLAGLGVGVWSDVRELKEQWRTDRCFEATIGEDQASAAIDGWHRAVKRARG